MAFTVQEGSYAMARFRLPAATALLFAVSGLLDFSGCTTHSTGAAPTGFVVAIVGDGVPTDHQCIPNPKQRTYRLNVAQGSAMWAGASLAYEHSQEVAPVRDLFSLYPCDDMGQAENAERIARELQSRPEVLAVIGHATSGTTRPAASLYSEAGIPLLMPIATSPLVFFDASDASGDKGRLHNAFRLPQSDDRGQVPALVIMAHSLKAKRVYLVRDISDDAGEYSSPIYNGLDRFLSDIIYDRTDVNRRQTDFPYIASIIFSEKDDLVIFAGYGSTAGVFLNALRERYAKDAGQRPTILLTDGAKIQDIDMSGFDAFLTFPVRPLRRMTCSSDDFEELEHAFGGQTTESYELFGFDAMAILGQAISICNERGRFSRSCIRDVLNTTKFHGACDNYKFTSGENVLSPYAVYSSKRSKVPQPLQFYRLISSDEINDVLSRVRE